MEPAFDIVFTGKLKPGVDKEQVIGRFCREFAYDETIFREKLEAGRLLVLKKGVNRETADNVVAHLTELGMIVEAQPIIVRRNRQLTELSRQEPSGTIAISAVPAGRGVNWLTESYRLYVQKDIGAWVGSAVVLILIFILLSLIPVLGSLVANVLAPVFTAGLMLGARAQDQGQAFSIHYLFRAFGDSTRNLILVGVIYSGGILLITLAAFFLFGSVLALLGGFAGDGAATAIFNNAGMVLFFSLGIMLLILPLMMAYWFAPALVVLDDLSPVEAMKASFSGCQKNVKPFLVYGLIVMVLSLIAAVPMMLGFLLLMPVMVASMYISYRDIYHQAAM